MIAHTDGGQFIPFALESILQSHRPSLSILSVPMGSDLPSDFDEEIREASAIEELTDLIDNFSLGRSREIDLEYGMFLANL